MTGGSVAHNIFVQAAGVNTKSSFLVATLKSHFRDCHPNMFLHCSQVSCPGVHLPAKDDIYLSMCFMGQYHQSECLPAVFPLLFHEKMTFEKAGL